MSREQAEKAMTLSIAVFVGGFGILLAGVGIALVIDVATRAVTAP